MKKEKWMISEIERWRAEEIINDETAGVLKKMYEPKKSLGLLIVLFSIIGTLFIGTGIILIGANNWWYDLSIVGRTFIAFLPLVASQSLMFYVYKFRMHSIAFREGAAILNMAGVFSSIAIVGQIFHLPGDFTNYVLICGILSLPAMLAMNAVSPLIVYYWTVINGGLYLSIKWGMSVSVILFSVGAAFAVYNFRSENGKAVYLSWITAITGFILIILASLYKGCEPTLILIAYFAFLLAVSTGWEKAGRTFKISGITGILILLAVTTYQDLWQYNIEFEDVTFIVVTVVLITGAVLFTVRNFINKKQDIFMVLALILLAMRALWAGANLSDWPFDIIFMMLFNLIMLATGVWLVWRGTKKVDLVSANIGMITVCTLIVMRFFDSGMSLAARGVVFLILGVSLLIFNLYLIRIKKQAKEETV